jgi:hypothetical protein
LFLLIGEEESCDWADMVGTQVAEAPDKEAQGDKQPKARQQGASGRVPVLLVSLAALAIIGAATANSLPSFNRFSLPDFSHFSLPNFDHVSLPNFDHFSWPDLKRLAALSPREAQSPPETASAPIPDPVVHTALRDIQLSQQQNAVVLASLTQSSATQQADLKRVSRQLSALAAQAETIQSAMTPLTTSSIPRPNPRARPVRTSRKIIPALPKPVGPVSVGGAPLNPARTPGSGAT